jgi:serine O-acetyltransferase
MRRLLWINTWLNLWRVLPAYVCFVSNKFRRKCQQDLEVWMKYETSLNNCKRFSSFAFLMVNCKEIRVIVLNRLHRNPIMWCITRMLFPPLANCYINMPPEKLGGGFSFQHGFSTVVSAKEIGENCRIFQQVTVGFNGKESPVIGNNVEIMAGAIVIGGICIGDDARIGAGSVVTHDVAERVTVVGVPAHPIC